LNNLFRDMDSVGYKTMLKGKPHALMSNFKISPNLMLNLIDIGDKEFVEFAKRSMVTKEIDSQLGELYAEIVKLEKEMSSLCVKTSDTVVRQYMYLSSQKQTKQIVRELREIEKENREIKKIVEKQKEMDNTQSQFAQVEQYIDNRVANVIHLLKNDGFITDTGLEPIGRIAMQLREVNCLAFAKMMSEIEKLETREIVSLLSCFTNVRVSEEKKTQKKNRMIELATQLYEKYGDEEIHYDLVNYTVDWCEAKSEEECKLVLQEMSDEKEIFLGEFVKALLKINNIASELEKVAELTGNMSFLSKLKEIPAITLKYVVTNQSLYLNI
jgi:hypothetical protein